MQECFMLVRGILLHLVIQICPMQQMFRTCHAKHPSNWHFCLLWRWWQYQWFHVKIFLPWIDHNYVMHIYSLPIYPRSVMQTIGKLTDTNSETWICFKIITRTWTLIRYMPRSMARTYTSAEIGDEPQQVMDCMRSWGVGLNLRLTITWVDGLIQRVIMVIRYAYIHWWSKI